MWSQLGRSTAICLSGWKESAAPEITAQHGDARAVFGTSERHHVSSRGFRRLVNTEVSTEQSKTPMVLRKDHYLEFVDFGLLPLPMSFEYLRFLGGSARYSHLLVDASAALDKGDTERVNHRPVALHDDGFDDLVLLIRRTDLGFVCWKIEAY